MRKLTKRRTVRSFFVKLCLALLAVGAIVAYGKFGSISGACRALASLLFPEDVAFTVAESAPILPTGGNGKTGSVSE